MNSDDLRQLFETAREQEVAGGLQSVRVVPIVSALLKAADELDEACRLLKMSRQCLTVKFHQVETGRIDTFLEKHK